MFLTPRGLKSSPVAAADNAAANADGAMVILLVAAFSSTKRLKSSRLARVSLSFVRHALDVLCLFSPPPACAQSARKNTKLVWFGRLAWDAR